MASSDPDRDRNSPSPKNKDDNPFVRFKRFADAQIGTVLQGIIGLPSALSKPTNDDDSRWTMFHEDLKRHDKNAAEQQSSVASGQNNSRDGFNEENREIPVKTIPSCSTPAFDQAHLPISPTANGREDVEDSIDLYFPVTKSLFKHLNWAAKDEVDWDKRSSTPDFPWDLFGRCKSSKDPFYLSEYQKNGDALTMIQSMVYNNLNKTAANVECRQFHGQNSTLPYVLFSPYSPLALSTMPPPRKQEGIFERTPDDFPYCEAFEDLLLISQGRPMGCWASIPAEIAMGGPKDDSKAGGKESTLSWADRRAVVPNQAVDNELTKARVGMGWILDLHKYGLLSDEPTSAASIFLQLNSQSESPFRTKITIIKPDHEGFAKAASIAQSDPNTEQDMYERFLDVASPSPGAVPSIIDSLMTDAERFVREKLDIFNRDQPGSTEHKNSKVSTIEFGGFDLDKILRDDFGNNESESTQTESSADSVSKTATKRAAVKTPVDADRSGEGGSIDPDRVVSTTTSTKQTADETGMVRTTVKIEKVYADGRTSITRTTNVQQRPLTASTDGVNDSQGGQTQTGSKMIDGKQAERMKDKSSKGWFWN